MAEAKEYEETYHNLSTEKNGDLEFDLVSHRQRGIEKITFLKGLKNEERCYVGDYTRKYLYIQTHL